MSQLLFKVVNMEISETIQPGNFEGGFPLEDAKYIDSPFMNAFEHLLIYEWKEHQVAFASLHDLEHSPDFQDDYSELEHRDVNLDEARPNLRYFINMDSGEYIDLHDVRPDSQGRRIHPLPLLLSTEYIEYVGKKPEHGIEFMSSWACDRIMCLDDSMVSRDRMSEAKDTFRYIRPAFSEETYQLYKRVKA